MKLSKIKGKKADIEDLLNWILWIIFIALLLFIISYILKRFGLMG